MARLPEEFREEFEDKQTTFFEIAELLYSNTNRQFTQDEIAEIVERSNTTVSNHTQEMVDADWLDRREDQITFSWNTEAYNPASTEGITAIKWFYLDFWKLIKKHSETFPGAFAIVGFTFILAALVLFVFFVGFSLGLSQDNAIPGWVYLTISLGSFLVGVIVTFISPLQAVVNRIVDKVLNSISFLRD